MGKPKRKSTQTSGDATVPSATLEEEREDVTPRDDEPPNLPAVRQEPEYDWLSEVLDRLINFIPDTIDFLTKIYRKFVPSWNDRYLAKLEPFVEEINALEPRFEVLSDEQLADLTPEFRKRFEDGETLDDLLPEAFAATREASKRAIGQRHFDVQLIGGIVLHRGNIAEMKTGEGKTLVATLPIYLNALSGKGVHLVTVNDYLARRDAAWMGPIYHRLGLTIGVIQHDLSFQYDPTWQDTSMSVGIAQLRPLPHRREAYACDITYGTNNEFGFDYLRDNMAVHPDDQVQRGLNFAIVDEVDSILVDEARTPLIISGPAEKSDELYRRFSQVVQKLRKDVDYTVDEKAHNVVVTEDGIYKVEKVMNVSNLYDPANIKLVHHLNASLKAKEVYKRDRDYVIEREKVIIVDEFTGRLMPGRRWSDGLHQAVEAKEGVKIERENQTLATITFQNYFRLYAKLAGMTGTAETEKQEFADIYRLDVVVIPTNRPLSREDLPDVIYRTQDEKYEAIIDRILERYGIGQPLLVGTISIERSELLASKLKKRGIPHEVLNAKQHAKEAEIVKNAGHYRSVMIATNMAGRGTDIVLDGDAREAGGLFILGTERHDSRRIDNQLRGRSGRQGDPGASQFYLSMEDDLMRMFGGPRIKSIMERLGWEKGEPIEHRMVTNAIERAQRRVEGEHYEMRKHILKYDDVMNEQRSIIYRQRQKALTETDLRKHIMGMIEDTGTGMVDLYMNPEMSEAEWQHEELTKKVQEVFGLHIPATAIDRLARDEIRESVLSKLYEQYERRERHIQPDAMRQLEKWVLLNVVDEQWKDHLYSMDHIREGIHWEGYGGKDPLVQYKLLGRDAFNEMIEVIKERVCRYLYRLEVDSAGVDKMAQEHTEQKKEELQYGAPKEADEAHSAPKATQKVGRNDPCPCGSGKKYKKCHGA